LECIFLRRTRKIPYTIRILVRCFGCCSERCRGHRNRAPLRRARSQTIRPLRKHRGAYADSFLAWLLERYLVPATLLANGRWFRDYLQRRLNAARSATDPVDAFVPTADADHLMEARIIKAREPPRMTSLQREDDASTTELFAELRALRREADALLNSTSWRITAPLGRLKQASERLRRRTP